MCGRVNVHDNEGVRQLLEAMSMPLLPSNNPRFNVAPTQTLEVVTFNKEPALESMNWGVSMTLKGKQGQSIAKRVPNARADKVWSSYLWRHLMPEQRVLIPVNGFYEWKRENKKPVQAYYITRANSKALFFAGIFKASKDGDKKPEVSIITTTANDAMQKVHDRMPVILSSQNEAMSWLQDSDKDSINALMQATRNDTLVFTPVSNYVNKSSNEGPECIQPA